MIVYGLNPVLEALRAGRVRKLRVGPRADRRVEDAIALARKAGVTVERTDAASLDRVARGGVHQGLAADVEAPRDYGIDELVAAAAPQPPLLVVLDGVEDPYNVGAILRSVDACGGHGVVRQARHAASLDGIVAKASAGAVTTVRIATVVNIARALDELKDAGVWTVGLAAESTDTYDAIDSHAADRDRARCRGERSAPPGPRALRPAGVDPDARAGRKPECVCRCWSYAVRSGPSTGETKWCIIFLSPLPVTLNRSMSLRPWHAVCYKYRFVWAGVAQSGRAADL